MHCWKQFVTACTLSAGIFGVCVCTVGTSNPMLCNEPWTAMPGQDEQLFCDWSVMVWSGLLQDVFLHGRLIIHFSQLLIRLPTSFYGSFTTVVTVTVSHFQSLPSYPLSYLTVRNNNYYYKYLVTVAVIDNYCTVKDSLPGFCPVSDHTIV